MGFLAVVVAQILDPIRIVALLVLFGLSSVAENRGARWFGLAVGYLLISIVWPGILTGYAGPLGAMTFSAGLISNAVILGLMLLAAKLWRG
jgi:hypothetical protein